MINCRGCEPGIEHCHGTLVRHDDESWECTAGADGAAEPCTGDVLAHDFVLSCGDLWAGCCSDRVSARAGLAATA